LCVVCVLSHREEFFGSCYTSLVFFFLFFFFFFSSRRRHTRLVSDWSSDVCSSDLSMAWSITGGTMSRDLPCPRATPTGDGCRARSEERRVGKECRSRGAPDH